jgi:hypothetical protein
LHWFRKSTALVAIYRTLVRFDINKVPQERKQQVSIFKEYEPGYLHIWQWFLVLTPKRRAKSILLVLAQRIIALECELVLNSP